jgi:hypothetical protein
MLSFRRCLGRIKKQLFCISSPLPNGIKILNLASDFKGHYGVIMILPWLKEIGHLFVGHINISFLKLYLNKIMYIFIKAIGSQG